MPGPGEDLSSATLSEHCIGGFLQAFAAGHCPSHQEIALAATECGVDDVQQALANMAAYDLVQREFLGCHRLRLCVLGDPTNHVVTLDSGFRLNAMCAVGALGIPSMLRTDAVITTSDPITGADISVTVDAFGSAHAWPAKGGVVG